MPRDRRSPADPEAGAASRTPDSEPFDGDGVPRLDCRIDASDGERTCTLFPADASGDELVTTWVTAEEGAFVDAADWR
jgi:hypothetical protein